MATWAALRDGSWGARLVGREAQDIAPGDGVTVVTRSGRVSDATIDRIVWRGEDRDGQQVALCAVTTQARKSAARDYDTGSRYGRDADYDGEFFEDAGGF